MSSERVISGLRLVLTVSLLIMMTTVIGFGVGQPSGQQIPGQVIVRMQGQSSINKITGKFDVSVKDSISTLRAYLVQFPEDLSLDSIVNDMAGDLCVEGVGANYRLELPEVHQISQGFPDENAPSFLKGISPPTYYDQAGDYDIGIDAAHDIVTGLGVRVAVIDNGLDFNHPLMVTSHIVPGHDFVNCDPFPHEEPGLMYGHGTFVTGLLLMVAPECSVMPVRAFDGDGIGTAFDVMRAIRWSVEQHAAVINMSFGLDNPLPMLNWAIQDALNAGVGLVASAGNEGLEVASYPAAYPGVIAVTSCNQEEIIADFANYGSHLDLIAPGVGMYSSLPGEHPWGTWSGTSFSAPLVSGTVALVRSLPHEMWPENMQGHLRASARTDLAWGGIVPPDLMYGYGLVDAYSAVANCMVGDLDASGAWDIQDLEMLVAWVNGEGSQSSDDCDSTGIRLLQADLNCDGVVGEEDIALMVRLVFEPGYVYRPCAR